MNSSNVPIGPDGITRLPAPAISGDTPSAMSGWVASAACSGADPEIFFAATAGSDAEAKALCAQCPVRSHCLEYSLATGPHWGVWGGLNETERNALARRRKRRRTRAGTALAAPEDVP